METNQMIIMITYQVVYQQIPQIMHQNLLNIQHMKISPETDILLQVIQLVNTLRVIIQVIGHSTIIIERKQIKQINQWTPKSFCPNIFDKQLPNINPK